MVACPAHQPSAKLFRPHRDLSVYEQMVKSKGWPSVHQYIKDKVTKEGYKLWVLVDPGSGYTVQFSVYTGRCVLPGMHYGLAFDVVCNLFARYLDQGCKIFMDNFLCLDTSVCHLLECWTLVCGTTLRDH